MANTYGLSFIKNGGIWIFQVSRSPLLGGGLHVTCNSHFRTWLSYRSQKSCVNYCFGLVESFKSYLNFPVGQKPPIRGVTCDLRYPFSNLGELFHSKIMCENLVQIDWAFQELSCPQTFFQGEKPPSGAGGGVTFDLWYPCWKSDVLFQSKVMC